MQRRDLLLEQPHLSAVGAASAPPQRRRAVPVPNLRMHALHLSRVPLGGALARAERRARVRRGGRLLRERVAQRGLTLRGLVRSVGDLRLQANKQTRLRSDGLSGRGHASVAL